MPSFTGAWTNSSANTTIQANLSTVASTTGALIYEVNAGSGATADNAVAYSIVKTTAKGTSSTSFTANDNSGNTATANSIFDTAWNIAPTTAGLSASVLTWGQHQRGTYRWVAYDYTKMLGIPASAAGVKGLAFYCNTVSTGFVGYYSILWQE